MKWLLIKLPLRILFVTLLLFFIWQLIVFFRPRPAAYTQAEVRAIALVCDRLISEMATELDRRSNDSSSTGQQTSPLIVGLAHLLNDPRDTATGVMRDRLNAHPRFEVHEGSILKKFFSDVTKAFSEATSLEEVLQAGQKVELDIVIAGRMLEVILLGENKASAKADLIAWDVRAGNTLTRQTLEATWEPTWLQTPDQKLRALSAFQRLLIWLALVLSAPWLTAFATHRILERKSNAASFTLLLSYTIFGTALAVMFTRATPGTNGYWLTILASLIITAAYSFRACERIASRR